MTGESSFLDTKRERSSNELKFRVYQKPTNKNDLPQHFSVHSKHSKIRHNHWIHVMHSKEYLNREMGYIIKSFNNLVFPMGLLLQLKRKVIKCV